MKVICFDLFDGIFLGIIIKIITFSNFFFLTSSSRQVAYPTAPPRLHFSPAEETAMMTTMMVKTNNDDDVIDVIDDDNDQQVIQGLHMVSGTRCPALSDRVKKWSESRAQG